MTEIPFIPSMRPEPARDSKGLYILPDPAGEGLRSWTRATTIAHALDDTFTLTQWQRRMVLTGAAMKPDLLANVPDLAQEMEQAGDNWRQARELRQELDSLCDQAADSAGANQGSKWGTAMHTITEYDDAGRFEEIAHLVPDAMLQELRAYRTAMSAARLQCPAEFIERVVVNSRIDSAGTFDRLIRMPDGRLVVGDLKTQASVDFGWLSIAIQLAEYAQADAMYDEATKSLVPLPSDLDRSVGIVMHLPRKKASCAIYQIDLEAGWQAAMAAHEVRQWRARSKAMGRPFTVPSAPVGDRVLTLIRSAGHPDALTALWRDLDPQGQWTEVHTQAAVTRKAELLAPAR